MQAFSNLLGLLFGRYVLGLLNSCEMKLRSIQLTAILMLKILNDKISLEIV